MQKLGVDIPVKRRDPHYFLPTTGLLHNRFTWTLPELRWKCSHKFKQMRADLVYCTAYSTAEQDLSDVMQCKPCLLITVTPPAGSV